MSQLSLAAAAASPDSSNNPFFDENWLDRDESAWRWAVQRVIKQQTNEVL
jgi:hypothetical protein